MTLSTCSVTAFLKYIRTFECLLQAKNSMTCAWSIQGVLIQIWLKFISELIRNTSGCIDAQKESLRKTSGVHANSRKTTKSV